MDPDVSVDGWRETRLSLYQEIFSHPAGKKLFFPPGKVFPPDKGLPAAVLIRTLIAHRAYRAPSVARASTHTFIVPASVPCASPRFLRA